ncbi:MAG: hypothetical protein IKA48_09010, partial [Fibrobacter sp.]|nr:hypothetical protein [Fibrobacter sp.]
TLRGNLYPYQRGQYYGLEYVSLKYDSECWFNGYIAKTKTCADGTPETTELYREKYEDIFWECLNLIEKQLDEITE